MAEENPREFQLGDRPIKALRPVKSSNIIPYLHVMSIGSHISLGGGWKERGKGIDMCREKWISTVLCHFVMISTFIQEIIPSISH